jgi:hypothetical protein
MIKKQIQKHDFLTGGPEIQYRLDLSDISFGNNLNNVTAENFIMWDVGDDTIITPRIILHGTQDNNIFVVNENEISWNGRTLVTEERVREIVLESLVNLRGE